MNLYKLKFEHFSQKDSREGILGFLFAISDEQVYNYLVKEECTCWEYDEDNDCDIYNSDYDLIGTETGKEKNLRLKGDIHDEEKELTDLYYGATLYGWELVKENVVLDDYKTMLELEDVNIYGEQE